MKFEGGSLFILLEEKKIIRDQHQRQKTHRNSTNTNPIKGSKLLRKNDRREDGRRHPLKEDQGKGMGMGFKGRSPESPGQFLECHLALFAWDDLLH